eukprot:11546363-Karenia_brevis.AAC.1
MLTSGEAKGIVQAHPDNGIQGWMKMHDRWNRKSSMGYTVVAEKIRSIPKSKTLDEVFGKLLQLEKLYLEYVDSGGKEYTDTDRKVDILRVVPQELNSKLLMEFDDMDEASSKDLLTK